MLRSKCGVNCAFGFHKFHFGTNHFKFKCMCVSVGHVLNLFATPTPKTIQSLLQSALLIDLFSDAFIRSDYTASKLYGDYWILKRKGCKGPGRVLTWCLQNFSWSDWGKPRPPPPSVGESGLWALPEYVDWQKTQFFKLQVANH
jgi:hypothetical protein